ncbi:MAG: glycosyltransferase family 25 protein [Alphaproteobacteria bacterium]|nr:glycosyltransferase family 25 protein [Alphaproteobacteria bacterium]
MPIPIYVIALKSSTERRDVMSARLARAGYDFTFIDAVHGASMTAEAANAAISPRRQYQHASPISRGALGGCLSHFNAWSRIAESDAPMALILEDDACLHDDLDEVLRRLDRLEGKIDIVNLHFRGGRPLIDVAQLSPTHRLTSCRYNSIGAESYVITRAAAAHLLTEARPVVHEVDLYLNRWWDHGLHVLTVNPPVVHEDDSPTTIGYPAKVAGWPNDKFWHRFRRRLSRIMDSTTKRRMYPSMVATMKMRLMGTDPSDVGNNPDFPNLIKMTDGK